jgi:hypothetical protein
VLRVAMLGTVVSLANEQKSDGNGLYRCRGVLKSSFMLGQHKPAVKMKRVGAGDLQRSNFRLSESSWPEKH